VSDPKLHHYVPQFYLRRFTDSAGRLWVWDRDMDRVFPTGPRSIAAESGFYFLTAFIDEGHDPLIMERQFADLEGEVSVITDQWLDWIRHGELGDRLPVPDANRELVSLFLALQFLRTEDARSILVAVAESAGTVMESENERRALHTEMLWSDQLVASFARRIRDCSWIFGRTSTSTPFVTSDNPIAFRSPDNLMWLKAGVLSEGTYLVFPLAPDVIMYCHPDEGPWRNARLSRLDCHISPVTFTDELVESENSGQVFMASRFVISNTASFDREREFAKTIGTDAYAPPGIN
jgi:Protein of unknown function (DUF4238)